MGTTTKRKTAPAVTLDEVEASELEGSVKLEEDQTLRTLVTQFNSLRQAEEKIAAEKKVIGDKLSAHLEKNKLHALTLNGRAIVQRTKVNGSKFNQKGLREKHPRIWAAFHETVPHYRMTIEKGY